MGEDKTTTQGQANQEVADKKARWRDHCNGAEYLRILAQFGGPLGTVPELLFGKKQFVLAYSNCCSRTQDPTA